VAAITVAFTLAACAQEARPEGIVENWLRSLNQGAAGRPDRYAPDTVSGQVVPGWHDLDPGELDVIEVGAPTTTGQGRDVPFHVVNLSGDQTFAVAHLVADDGSWRIESVETIPPASGFETAAETRAGLVPGWPLAALVTAVLSLGALALLTVVRRRARPAR